MSKLPNAPLLEVIYELRWEMSSQDDFNNFQYLHGDLFNTLKEFYPKRENAMPIQGPPQLFVNSPIYRFRANEGYPLFQLGPGILTLNTIDDKYKWEDYYSLCQTLTNSFIQQYQQYTTNNQLNLKPSLVYFDFFKFDYANNDVISFFNDQLNIKFGNNFFENHKFPLEVSAAFKYKTEIGVIEIALNAGKNQNSDNGIVMRTQLDGDGLGSNVEEILSWLNEAHEFCSKLFKDMTKGSLYESFKS